MASATASVLLAVMVVACGGGATAPSTPASSAPAGNYASANFVFHYTALDAGNIAAIAAAVEGERARFLADLRVEVMPAVEVTFHADHAALQAAVRAIVGAIPAFASGLVTSSTQIHMISPNAAAAGPGKGGTITVSNDGRYGDLVGKGISLEPATGFSFDTPMVPRPRPYF